MPTPNRLGSTAPESIFRSQEGLGVWEHKGKVAAVGIGHSPTARRWDGTAENTIGAWSLMALRKAIDDAGVPPEEIDGLVFLPTTTTGAHWPADRPIPMDVVNAYETTDDPLDGIAKLTDTWLLKNMPELTNVKFVMAGMDCMSNAIAIAAQAVGDGMTGTCLVLKAWHNLEGRYSHGGANAEETISGNQKWSNPYGSANSWGTAQQFQRYLWKYGKTKEMMTPFMVNSRRNGLMFPEGYWYQHRPEELTPEDYQESRWIAKPANLFDNDIPIHTAAAYVITTAERAKDMKQKPAYILNHAADRTIQRGLTQSLEEAQRSCASTGRKLLEGAGISASDLSFENMYDGFSLFHVFHMEGLGFAGVKEGEGLDLFQEDISIEGPHPVSPSGGNVGSGRTRFWMHTDSIQQIQGRAGDRQISKPAEIGVSGGPLPLYHADFIVWGASPD